MVKANLKEALRKSVHISSVAIPLAYRYILGFNNRLLMFILMLVALILSLGIEFYRLHIPSFRKLFHRMFGLILRRHEHRDFTGSTFLIFAGMLSVAFFEPIIAFLAMSYLSIGDTFAAMVGRPFGKRKLTGSSKSIEGSLACFTSIMIFSVFFGGELSPWVYTLGALAATLAEAWKIPVDDNVKIPLISGIVMSIVHIFI